MALKSVHKIVRCHVKGTGRLVSNVSIKRENIRTCSVIISQLNINPCNFSETVDKKSVSEYHERCQELKIQINYVEPPERVKLKSKSKESNSDGIIKEIKQLNNSRYTTELRKELFDGML